MIEKSSNSDHLLQQTQSRFHGLRKLLVTQFFVAFNDNAWKLMTTFLGIQAARETFVGSPLEFESKAQMITTIAFSALSIPLILFSLPGGWIADRWSKRSVIIFLKWTELLIMMAATLALIFFSHQFFVLCFLLALLGTQASLFSPSKYSILPELVKPNDLTYANSHLELWTFAAIILGTASGGLLMTMAGSYLWMSGLLLVVFSLIGLKASYQIPRTKPVNTGSSWTEDIKAASLSILRDKGMIATIWGSMFFWCLASLLGQNVLIYSKVSLNLSDQLSSLPLAICGIGLGIGSLLTSLWSGNRVENGLVPIGAIGIGLLSGFFSWFAPEFKGVLALMFFIGIASALMAIPLQSTLQVRSPVKIRGSVLAIANIFIFTGVFIGTFLTGMLAKFGFNTRDIFEISCWACLLNALPFVYFLRRDIVYACLKIFIRSLYKIRVLEYQEFPNAGGVLLLPNHVSFIDALLIMASLNRRVRFLVHRDYYEKSLLNLWMRILGCIPIASHDGPKSLLRSFQVAGDLLDAGEVVCLFPEGQLTRTGQLQPFRRGLERIIQNRKAVIIPLYIDRIWGSLFSRERDRFFWKIPKKIPYPITLSFGDFLPPSSPLYKVREQLEAASTRAWKDREKTGKSLADLAIRSCRFNAFKTFLVDIEERRITYFSTLVASIALARKLKFSWAQESTVGILLPPSIACSISQITAQLAGKIVVNLNYTSGIQNIQQCVKEAKIQTIISHPKLLEQMNLTELSQQYKVLNIEDLLKSFGMVDRFVSALIGLIPIRLWIKKLCGNKSVTEAGELSTVIFSSGSTGEPKGIMLSHFNINSNTDALAQILRVQSNDRLLGSLPLFHSFGNAAFWLALKEGCQLVVHPKPFDIPALGALIEKQKVTILMTTPTFLQYFTKRLESSQLKLIRFVISGAEKLSDRVSHSFYEKFGLHPLEGYGATECSPAISTNIPDFELHPLHQRGSKQGTVGRPIPGVSTKIIDPESRKELGPNEVGLLLVKGPNIMLGYLNKPEQTQSVIQDGWYITGDIAKIDEDGFITITDRISRFSKIGGEMVPHVKIEEVLHEIANVAVKTFSVTAIPDDQKGETLVVVHTLEETRVRYIIDQLGKSGLPNLYIPRHDRFIRVDELPVLGSGKIDLCAVKQIALKQAACPSV